ncbi:hypothetical protein BRC65_02310 [Halobacteriales archaeon QH_2_65_14]|nr:MAG: hypothetical protein BRC65_02310 [Halobacteriales archaeon QH_2_65_14]
MADEVGTYEATVTVTDDEGRTDTDTLYVHVEARDLPEALLSGPGTAIAGESRIYTLFGNAGDALLSSALWTLNGEYQESEDLGGQSSVSLKEKITFEKPGEYRLNGTLADEAGFQAQDSMNITVWSPTAHLLVTLTDTNSPVNESEVLEVDATVENLGQAKSDQPVWLTREGNVVDVIPGMELRPGETADVTLEWQTDPGDAGTHDIGVHSLNDTDSGEAVVTPGGGGDVFFAVGYTSPPPSTVAPGETVQPTVEVTNTGTATGTQTVVMLDIHGTPVESTEMTLSPGESRKVTTFSWTPTVSDLGTGDLVVQSEDDEASAEVTVQGSTHFDVEFASVVPTNTSKITPPGPHDWINVTVNVTNTGDTPGKQDIRLTRTVWPPKPTLPREQKDEVQNVTLDPGESTEVELLWWSPRTSDLQSCDGETKCYLIYTQLGIHSEDDEEYKMPYDRGGGGGGGNPPCTGPNPPPDSWCGTPVTLFSASEIEAGDSVGVSVKIYNHYASTEWRGVNIKSHHVSSYGPGSYKNWQAKLEADDSAQPGQKIKVCVTMESWAGSHLRSNYDPKAKAPAARKGSFGCSTIPVVDGGDDGGGGGGR